MSLSNGLLNLTNWLGNVIMPTLAGLFAATADLSFQQGPQLSALRLCGAGFADVFGLAASDGIIQQPGELEQPRPLLDIDSDAGELGRECPVAALRRTASCARRHALLRLA